LQALSLESEKPGAGFSRPHSRCSACSSLLALLMALTPAALTVEAV